MSVKPHAVVFDLDGLMFNTEELYQFVGSEGTRWSRRSWARIRRSPAVLRP